MRFHRTDITATPGRPTAPPGALEYAGRLYETLRAPIRRAAFAIVLVSLVGHAGVWVAQDVGGGMSDPDGLGLTGASDNEPVFDGGGLDASPLDSWQETQPAAGTVVDVLEDVPAPHASVVLLTVYRRYDDSDPLDHEARADIYEVVTESPGMSMTEIAREADLALSTARYHSRVLEEEDVLTEVVIRGRRRLYPAGMERERMQLAAALEDEATASILDAVAGLEPVSVSELAGTLDRTVSTVSYHLDRLADAGLVQRERRGNSVVTRLAPPARATLANE